MREEGRGGEGVKWVRYVGCEVKSEGKIRVG